MIIFSNYAGVACYVTSKCCFSQEKIFVAYTHGDKKIEKFLIIFPSNNDYNDTRKSKFHESQKEFLLQLFTFTR